MTWVQENFGLDDLGVSDDVIEIAHSNQQDEPYANIEQSFFKKVISRVCTFLTRARRYRPCIMTKS
jgi:hypothetical protein